MRNVADEHAAFGWAQVRDGGVVGELRCAAGSAARLEEFLLAGPPDAVGFRAALTLYANSRIKLHFATFKVLVDDRDTAFVFADTARHADVAAAAVVDDEDNAIADERA